MLNLDFSQRIVINSHQQTWQDSPMIGVTRKLLAREAEENGHATSIVRYQPGAQFSLHQHPLGEEILVLEGVFSDQSGDYPKGFYLRNPPGSQHAPFSREGCTIFVKLHQFAITDRKSIAIDTTSAKWTRIQAGLEQIILHQHHGQQISMLRCDRDLTFELAPNSGGEEWLVVAGQFADQAQLYPTGTWLRQPSTQKQSGRYHLQQGSLLWLKQGHLPLP